MLQSNNNRINRYYRHTGLSVLCAALLIVLAHPAGAQVAPSGKSAGELPSPLTLEQAIAIALKQQPQEYIARTQQTQAAGQRMIAQSQYLPKVTPTYQYQSVQQTRFGGGTSYIVSGGGGNTGTQTISSSSSLNGGTSTLTLSQTLFDNGAREVVNAQARRGIDIANYNIADVRQQIVLAVTQDYYNLLRQVDQVKVSQADVERYQQTVALTQAQATAGTAAPKDVLQAQANLASAQITLLQNQNSIRTASASLKNSMGVESDNVVQAASLTTTAESALPSLPELSTEKTLDQYVTEAYNTRPDLKGQQATVSNQDLAVKSARLNTGLQVSGTYNYTYTPTNDIGTRGTGSSLYANLSYPLFDGGSSRASLQVAKAQRDAAKNQLELQRQSVRLNVETYYVQRSEALQRTRLAQTAIQAAQINYDAAVASRKAGVATILDVTTAQATLTSAQNQYVGAVYDFYIAAANLDRAVGTITNDTTGK